MLWTTNAFLVFFYSKLHRNIYFHEKRQLTLNFCLDCVLIWTIGENAQPYSTNELRTYKLVSLMPGSNRSEQMESHVQYPTNTFGLFLIPLITFGITSGITSKFTTALHTSKGHYCYTTKLHRTSCCSIQLFYDSLCVFTFRAVRGWCGTISYLPSMSHPKFSNISAKNFFFSQ